MQINRSLSTDRLAEVVQTELAEQIAISKVDSYFAESEFVDERTTMLSFATFLLLDSVKKYNVTKDELADIAKYLQIIVYK